MYHPTMYFFMFFSFLFRPCLAKLTIMKISLVILVIFMAAAWANEEDEQDETELIEIEDPSYWKPKYCGYLNKCRPVKKCRTVLRFKTVCRNYCNTVKKCSKHHSKHDPYGYYPPKVYCKPVKVGSNILILFGCI